MLSEVRYKKPHIVSLSLYAMSRPGQSIEAKSRLMVARSEGTWGLTAKGYRISFWGDENIPELFRGWQFHTHVNIL